MCSVVLQNSATLYHEEQALGLYLVGVQPDIVQVSSQTSSACAQDA